MNDAHFDSRYEEADASALLAISHLCRVFAQATLALCLPDASYDLFAEFAFVFDLDEKDRQIFFIDFASALDTALLTHEPDAPQAVLLRYRQKATAPLCLRSSPDFSPEAHAALAAYIDHRLPHPSEQNKHRAPTPSEVA